MRLKTKPSSPRRGKGGGMSRFGVDGNLSAKLVVSETYTPKGLKVGIY